MGVFRGIFGVSGGFFLLILLIHMLGKVTFKSHILSLIPKVLPMFFSAALIIYGVAEVF